MTSSKPAIVTGSCLCGAVTYSSTTLPDSFTNCHCTTCRKLSGAPYITFGAYTKDAITWTSGEAFLAKMSYSDMANRGHCSKCASNIYMTYHCEPGYIGIAAGTIDELKGKWPEIKQHIFVTEGIREAWERLPDDGIPRFVGFSPRFEKELDDWKKGSGASRSGS